jgi:peptidoglycan/xylan/chitin deacetylase (PgdA/CDA1 family)
MPASRIVFWAATLAVIGLTIRSVVAGPPPIGVAAMCAVAYGAVILAGVLSLNLRMFADAVVRGPSDARGVALTFDDGPHPVHTRRILDILDARGAKATFFVIGTKAKRHRDVVEEIVRRGHTVGVHGFAHDRLFSLRPARRVREDLARAVALLEEILGERPTLFRPPVGHTNPTIARVADELDLEVVGWSVRGRDGIARTKSGDVVRRVARGIADGAIVLLHDAAERDDREPASIDALPKILDAIDAKNLRVVPLATFLEIEEPQARGSSTTKRAPRS